MSSNNKCVNNFCYHCELKIFPFSSSILPPALIVVFLLGLPGNLMALYVFCRNLQSWRPTVVFLFNLVLADLILLLNVPFRVDYHLRHENWVFGSTCCRINLFMLSVNRSASISFMSALAVDRYFKIVHPHHKINDMSSSGATGIACGIWTVVVLLKIPLLTNELLNKVGNTSLCRSFNSYAITPLGMKLHNLVYISEFFFALALLVFCSHQIYCIFCRRQLNRKKNVRQAIRMLLVIDGVFLICFCPGVVTGLITLCFKTWSNNCDYFHVSSGLFIISIGATYLNSMLDPIIYGFSSSLFRAALMHSIKWLGMEKLLRNSQNTPT